MSSLGRLHDCGAQQIRFNPLGKFNMSTCEVKPHVMQPEREHLHCDESYVIAVGCRLYPRMCCQLYFIVRFNTKLHLINITLLSRSFDITTISSPEDIWRELREAGCALFPECVHIAEDLIEDYRLEQDLPFVVMEEGSECSGAVRGGFSEVPIDLPNN